MNMKSTTKLIIAVFSVVLVSIVIGLISLNSIKQKYQRTEMNRMK
jgi:hypothetical protein